MNTTPTTTQTHDRYIRATNELCDAETDLVAQDRALTACERALTQLIYGRLHETGRHGVLIHATQDDIDQARAAVRQAREVIERNSP